MKKDFDYLIIGAGPAGLQLGYFLDRENRDYLILDAAENVGSFYSHFPRHGQLLTVNKIYTGYDEDPKRRLRYDWNSLLSDSEEMVFRNFSQDFLPKREDFHRYLQAFAGHFDLNIQFNSRVEKISKPDNFEIFTESGTQFHCNKLIIATP